MRDIEDAMKFLLPHVPNCSDLAGFAALRLAAREICSTADVWTEYDTIEITDPEDECATSIGDAAISKILKASLNGVVLSAIAPADLDEIKPDWDFSGEHGTPKYITQTSTGRFRVYPLETGTLKVKLALKPTLDAMTLPDALIDEYGEQLGWGAAMYALLHAHDDSGAAPEQATTLSTLYQPFLAGLNTKTVKGIQRARIRTKGSYF